MDYVGRPLLAGVFIALLWLQWRFPLRRQHFSALHRLVRNFVPRICSPIHLKMLSKSNRVRL
jgi:hypothetical protein